MRLLFILAILMVLVVGGFFAVKNLPDRNAANVNTPSADKDAESKYNGFEGRALSVNENIMTLTGRYLSAGRQYSLFDNKLVQVDISSAVIIKVTRNIPPPKPGQFGADLKDVVEKSERVSITQLLADHQKYNPTYKVKAYDDITGEVRFKAETVTYSLINQAP
jgi:hypothetical protein